MTPYIEQAIKDTLPIVKSNFDQAITRETLLRIILDSLTKSKWSDKLSTKIKLSSFVITHETEILHLITLITLQPRSFLQELVTDSLRYRKRLTKPYRMNIPNHETVGDI